MPGHSFCREDTNNNTEHGMAGEWHHKLSWVDSVPRQEAGLMAGVTQGTCCWLVALCRHTSRQSGYLSLIARWLQCVATALPLKVIVNLRMEPAGSKIGKWRPDEGKRIWW